MRTELVILVLWLPAAGLATASRSEGADKPVTVTQVQPPDHARPKEGKIATPVAAGGTADAKQIMAQLRGKFPHKTDDEIIHVLRGYAPADKPTGGGEMSWFTGRLQQARKQKEAIEGLDHCCLRVRSGKPPPAPPWLRALLGDDFFTTVDEVVVGQGSLTDAQLRRLSAFPRLRVLRLDGCFPKNTDFGLRNLEGLSQLQELSLDREQKVTDAGLECVGKLAKLRSLSLGWTKVTDSGVQHLLKLARLEALGLHGTRVTDAGIVRLAGLPNLESLDIQGTQATEAVLACAKDWPKLRHLCHDFPLGDQGLALLAQFPQLRNPTGPVTHDEVRLRGVTDEGMARVEAIGKPDFLCIDAARITTGWSHLDRMASVECLTIKHTAVDRGGMAAIARLPKLRGLTFEGAQITGGWDCLTKMNELDPIYSAGTHWPREGLTALGRRPWIKGRISGSEGMTLGMIGRSCGPRIHELFLYPSKVGLNLADCPQYPQYMPFVIECRVHGPEMAALAAFSNVTLLEIDDEALAAAALPHIKTMSHLKELRLCCPMAFALAGIGSERDEKPEAPIDSRKPGFLFDLLRNPAPLEDLRGLAINVPSDQHLAFLAKLPHLARLRLYYDRNITDAGLERLKGLSSLRELCLTGTRVTAAGVGRLKALTNLQELWLDQTELTDAGLEHLRGMNHLTWLYIVKTRVTDVGVKKLKRALPNCRIIVD